MAKTITANGSGSDVGTMWTMTRNGSTARCALLSLPREWQLRVVVDGRPLLAKRCPDATRAFAVAEEWKLRLAERGWFQVKPRLPLSVA